MATNKNKQRGSKRSSPKNASSGIFSIVLSFFIGYALAHVFDINCIGKQLDLVLSSSGSKHEKIRLVQTKPDLPKPKFEYYSLLAKEGRSNRQANEGNQKQPGITASKASPLAPINQESHVYFLQLATYAKKEDADRMKAELILQGRSANIEMHKTESRILYRLMIGPFKRKTEAEKEQVDLAKQLHVMGMIRRTQKLFG